MMRICHLVRERFRQELHHAHRDEGRQQGQRDTAEAEQHLGK